ncbi:MAG: aldehyde ferredoxin oxidoreductase family protein [Methanosarcinales archaeon]|nr:aldehyde ferredoxin oxidoreductase family protein [Methanosarcinales archaeon]
MSKLGDAYTDVQVLRVDLSNSKVSEEVIKERPVGAIGGRGFATYLISREVGANTKPLNAENKLIFSNGPLWGTQIPFCGRTNMTSISPLTNTISSSNAGGGISFGKYDALIIEGQAESAVYIHIGKGDDDAKEGPDVQILDATDIWGKGTIETTLALTQRHSLYNNPVMTIGPAGENQVHFASITTRLHHVFGRGGLGAVMGSKNLKAIVSSQGSERSQPARRSVSCTELEKHLIKKVFDTPSSLKTRGTVNVLDTVNANEALPTRYFSDVTFESADRINGKAFDDYVVGRTTCVGCTVACKKITYSKKHDVTASGPEYETVMSFGSNEGNSDIDDIIKSNNLCNDLGMDTISCGNVISALMCASESGLVAPSDALSFGDSPHEMMGSIAQRSGIGNLLANGVEPFAKYVGIESMTVKGLDCPGHDARGAAGQGLGYMTANRGADHLYSSFFAHEYNRANRRDVRNKADALIEAENMSAFFDSMILCRFSKMFFEKSDFEDILSSVLQKPASFDDIQTIGSDIIEMERRFNCMRGFSVLDDVLPERMRPEHVEEELASYYRLRGWNENGCPK